ncbi:MAG: lipopolysaccharide biosynthesis protein [Puniceicoccales bacterium]
MSNECPATRPSDRYFSDKDVLKDIGKRTARGGVIMLLGQGVRLVLQMGSTIALARLLTPTDFGLVGLVTVLIGLIVLFRDFGLTQATVQRESIHHDQISNLFWFNVVLSTLVAGLFAASSPLIAAFYEQPKLVPITLALAAGLLVEGIGLQHRALMMRAMQFSKLMGADVISQVIAVGLAIYMAWAGYGYWALVVLNVAGAFGRTAFYILNVRWFPGMPKRYVGTKPFLKYGSNLFGFNTVNFFSRNTDNILIGKFVGEQALGYYSMAYRLILLPMQQINSPLFQTFLPPLSRLADDAPRYRSTYIKLLSMMAYLSVSIICYTAINCKEVVLLVLGEEWAPATKLFLALLPLAYINATNIADGIVYASLGHTDRQFKWSFVIVPITVLSMIVGLPWGALGVAIGASASYILIRPFSIAYCYRGTFLRNRDFYSALWRPTLLAMTAALVAYLSGRLVCEY